MGVTVTASGSPVVNLAELLDTAPLVDAVDGDSVARLGTMWVPARYASELALSGETQLRVQGDADLDARITDTEAAITVQITSGDTALDTRITDTEAALNTQIDTRIADTETNLEALVSTGDAELDAKIASAFAALDALDASVDDALANKADLVNDLIPTSQLPAIATVQRKLVANQAERLALTADDVQPGDVAIEADVAETFMLIDVDPSLAASWKSIDHTNVVSVNGQTGTIILGFADVGAAAANDPRLSDQRVPTDGSVATAKIQDGAVSLAKLGVNTADGPAGTATMRSLGPGATQAAPGNDARFTDQRVPTDNSVSTVKLQDLSVSRAKIALTAIDTAQLMNGAVTTAKVANGAIAYAKLDPDTKDQAVGVSSMRSLGAAATQAAPGDHVHAPPAPVYPPIYENEFAGANVAGNLPLTSPLLFPFHSGTFVADATEAVVTVSVGATVVGQAWAPLNFFFAPNTVAGQLTPTVQGQALAAGVVQKKLSALQSTTLGPSSRTMPVKITGLVVGTTYKWELAAAITGVATIENLPNGPNKVACSLVSDISGHFHACVRNDTANSFTILKVAGLGVIVDPIASKVWKTINLPGGGTGGVAMSPDGTKAVAVNANIPSVTIVNCSMSDPSIDPTLQNTYAGPAGATVISAVAITPDSQTAWCVLQNLNQIVPLRLSDGTWGTPVGLGAAHAMTCIEITPNGAKAVVGTSDGFVGVFSLAGSANWPATPTAVLDGVVAYSTGTGIFHTDAIGITPDSTKAYIASGASFGFAQFNINTRTWGAFTAMAAAATSIRVLPDGLSLLAISNTAVAGEQVQHWNLTQNPIVRYVKWGLLDALGNVIAGTPGGLAVSSRGDILITGKSLNQIFDWTGAWMQLRPDAFHAEVCRVLVTPAH